MPRSYRGLRTISIRWSKTGRATRRRIDICGERREDARTVSRRTCNTLKPCTEPPFGVAWNTQQKSVTDEYEQRGFAGRFGPGLPRVSDGSLLFLMHLISKMQPVKSGEGGSRLAIVLNGSPLFTGGAGSGESNIRQWIIENDLLDAIIALPTDMFYNTGISTYIWVLDNNKPAKRKGKVQLINAVDMFGKMRKSLGSKRKELRPKDIERICNLYDSFRNQHATDEHEAHSKVFKGEEFGYSTITVERPYSSDSRRPRTRSRKSWCRRVSTSSRTARRPRSATLS